MHFSLIFLLGVLSAVLGLTGLVTGQTLNRRFSFIVRQERPVAYWSHVLVQMLAGLAAILYAWTHRVP